MLRQLPIRAATATAAPSRLLHLRPSYSSSSVAASTRFLTTEAAATTTTTTSQPTPPPPSPPAPADPSSTSTSTPPQQGVKQKQLSYLVERTASRHLSVYNDARAGGTRKQTVVKKIAGDTRALRDELVEELRFPRDDVKINPVTNHIKIKGFHAEKVQKWLEARGF